MSLSMVPPHHPALWTPAAPVVDIEREVMPPTIYQMKRILHRRGGRGLAAPQVGISLAFFIIRMGTGKDGTWTVINPVICMRAGWEEVEEGCLTWPGRTKRIGRPTSVTAVRQLSMSRISHTFTGLDARCFLHEYDHLQGVCLFERPVQIALDSERPV